MSYAAAAEKNSQGGGAQPSSEWLEGARGGPTDGHGTANEVKSSLDVDSGKVNVIPSDSDLEHIKTETADAAAKAKAFAEQEAKKLNEQGKKLSKDASREARKAEKTIATKAKEASAQIQEGWKHLSSDPKAWGSVLGAINIALLGGLGYFVYTERNNAKNWDRRVVGATTVGVLGLLGGQGYFAAETARKQTQTQGRK